MRVSYIIKSFVLICFMIIATHVISDGSTESAKPEMKVVYID